MDTLYYNGTIRTMEHFAPEEALLVRDGRVAAVGPFAQLLDQCTYTKKVDLAGACLMPAFLDAHSHIVSWAMGKLQADLGGAADYPAIAEAMGRFAREREIPPGSWVLGRGADMLLEESLVPLLDRVLPDRPAMVLHVSSHGGVFNTAAQRLLGLDRGALVENPFLAAQKKVPLPGLEELVQAFREAQNDNTRSSDVLAQEGCVTAEAAGLYAALEKAGALKMAVVGYGQPEMACDPGPIPTVGFTLRGTKIFLDGSPQQRTAFLRQPYTGGGLGEATMTEDEVLSAVRRAGGGPPPDPGPLQRGRRHRPVPVGSGGGGLPGGPAAGGGPRTAHAARPGGPGQASGGGGLLFPRPHTPLGRRPPRQSGGSGHDHQPLPLRPGPGRPHHPAPGYTGPSAGSPGGCGLRRPAADQGRRPAGPGGADQRVRGPSGSDRGGGLAVPRRRGAGDPGPGKRADLIVLDRDPAVLPPEELETVRVLATVGGGEVLWRREG